MTSITSKRDHSYQFCRRLYIDLEGIVFAEVIYVLIYFGHFSCGLHAHTASNQDTIFAQPCLRWTRVRQICIALWLSHMKHMVFLVKESSADTHCCRSLLDELHRVNKASIRIAITTYLGTCDLVVYTYALLHAFFSMRPVVFVKWVISTPASCAMLHCTSNSYAHTPTLVLQSLYAQHCGQQMVCMQRCVALCNRQVSGIKPRQQPLCCNPLTVLQTLVCICCSLSMSTCQRKQCTSAQDTKQTTLLQLHLHSVLLGNIG